MKVLIVGGGGREHALAWKAATSDRVREVLVAPGNAGTALEPGVRNVAVAADDVAALLALARSEAVDLTIVGPEAPLVAGLVDRFDEAGLRCLGPSAAAARLEGSKAWCKAFLARHGIPTAAFGSFTDRDEALAFVRDHGAPIVVKADGLAAGKGVVVARTLAEAEGAIEAMLGQGRLGEAGRRIVVEEFLAGEEASFIVLCDGRDVLPLASSQDHKARDDGDRGPNTGGMGAYSPAPVVTPAVAGRIEASIIAPTVAGLAAEGMPFRGFLYAGLMIDAAGVPRVLEFNVRCGDPETQPIMLRLRSDLITLCEHAIDGTLADATVAWDDRASLAVVLAAGGYPGPYERGTVIEGLDAVGEGKVFHAGTRLVDGRAVTDGGRVLSVCALGATVGDAQAAAYRDVARIHWPGMHFRRDIGHRALAGADS